MNISIVGLGYVGTVSAACLSGKGHYIWGVDINPEKVRFINEGRSPIVEPGLDERVCQAREGLRLRATCDVQKPRCVSCPWQHQAAPMGRIDPAHLFRACEQVATALCELKKRQIVVIRSSILPSIFDRCLGIFGSAAPGLVELCVNPEFLREGSAIHDFEEPPFTVLGTESVAVRETLRSVYSELSAPIFLLKPKEALMLKYASNTFHALKVAFANEIAALCQQAEVDAEAVMKVFCSDTQLNISERYLMPGFAFGGSCLPKDVRAILYAGKECDLQLPLIAAILASNEQVIERALSKIRATGARRVGLIGLCFKSNTDDLRESPFVELAERLLGKGYELSIYDPNVIVARLTGANKEYINRVIPHLSRLLVSSLDELSNAELLLVGHRFDGVDLFLQNTLASIIELSAHPTVTRPKLEFVVTSRGLS
jgi:GDP-mannose 6-dehydrogenase